MSTESTTSNKIAHYQQETIALILRLGLGAVFVIGGYSKLSQLLDPSRSQAIVDQYMGSAGYINTFFTDYLFTGVLANVFSPWGFLTALSSFELLSGLLLVAGLLVRPLALVYAFLLWTFVFSLPVVTTPGVAVDVKTYTAPALLVQIRDVALSGMMFVLFNLGAGRFSIDGMLAKRSHAGNPVSWDALGLLARLSIAAPLLVGGFFAGMSNIQSYGVYALVLIVLGALMVAGVGVRAAGIAIALVMVWFIANKISADKSLIANLNGFKREFAMVAAGIVLAVYGGGEKFVWFQRRRREGHDDPVADSGPQMAQQSP